MGEFRLCSVTESCSLSSREGGSAHEVWVERESVSRAQGTGLGAWDLGIHLKKVEARVSRLSTPSVPAPASHLTYLTKHRFQHKTRASRGSSTRAPNPHGDPLQWGLCVLWLHSATRLQSCPWLITAYDSSERGSGDEAASIHIPFQHSAAMWLLPSYLTTLCPSFLICKSVIMKIQHIKWINHSGYNTWHIVKIISALPICSLFIIIAHKMSQSPCMRVYKQSLLHH